MSTPAINWAQPNSDERTMAVLAHALQLVGGWIAPLVIFLVKKDSLFVRFHALQALLLQIAYFVCFFAAMAVWMVTMFTSLAMHAGEKSDALPAGFFIMFPLIWLLGMGGWVTMIVCAIVFSIKAGHGEWAAYPVLGKLARKFLKMDVPPQTPAITP